MQHNRSRTSWWRRGIWGIAQREELRPLDEDGFVGVAVEV
jgi:hypothetical protein